MLMYRVLDKFPETAIYQTITPLDLVLNNIYGPPHSKSWCQPIRLDNLQLPTAFRSFFKIALQNSFTLSRFHSAAQDSTSTLGVPSNQGSQIKICGVRPLYSCGLTSPVDTWKVSRVCAPKRNRFTAKSQQAATTVPHRLGRWWNRSREFRHNTATLQRWESPINVLQHWWTSKKKHQTTDQIRLFPAVPKQHCHHLRSWYFSVTLTIHHSSGTEVLARRLIGTCTQMSLIRNSYISSQPWRSKCKSRWMMSG